MIAKYKAFFIYDKEYDKKIEIYNDLIQESQFISVVTPIEKIKSNLKKIYSLEIELKREISTMLENELYNTVITAEIKSTFEIYLKEDWVYFSNEKYIDEELKIFYAALNNYIFILSRGYFLLKKDLLDFQSELLEKGEINYVDDRIIDI